VWSIDAVLVPAAAPRSPPPSRRPPPRHTLKSLQALVSGTSLFAQVLRAGGLSSAVTAASFRGTVLVPTDEVSGWLWARRTTVTNHDVTYYYPCCGALCAVNSQQSIGCSPQPKGRSHWVQPAGPMSTPHAAVMGG
jgi:hypothetical protein